MNCIKRSSACNLPQIALILALLVFASNICTSTFAQENAVLRSTATDTSATSVNGTREQSGLSGPVRRVRTESAKLYIKSGKLVESPRTLLEMATYDLQGVQVDTAYYSITNNYQTGREEYKYDGKGNITEMILRDQGNYIVRKELYTYEYDNIGNWTKMTTWVGVIDEGKPAIEPVEITYRAITYYLNESVARIYLPSPTKDAAGQVASNATQTADNSVLAAPLFASDTPTNPSRDGEKWPMAVNTDTKKNQPQSNSQISQTVYKNSVTAGPAAFNYPSSPGSATVAASNKEVSTDSSNVVKNETRLLNASASPVTPKAEEGNTSRSEIAKTNEPSRSNIPISSTSNNNAALNAAARSSEVKALNLAGVAHYEAGRYKEAVEAFIRVIKITPNDSGVQYKLGDAYSQLNRHDKAIKAFEQVVKIKPDFVYAHYNLGIVNYNLKRYRQAAKSYERALELKPGLAEAHYGLGLAYFSLGEITATEKQYKLLKPINEKLAQMLADVIRGQEMRRLPGSGNVFGDSRRQRD